MRNFVEPIALSRLDSGEIEEWESARAAAIAEGTYYVSWPAHCAVGVKPG